MKKSKKPDKSIRDIIHDWNNNDILITHNVFSRHIAEAAHDEAYEYYETLKDKLKDPESVVKSKTDSNTMIVNIKLENRKHKYLRVVIRYSTMWNRLLGKRNYITTFYGASSPMNGEKIL
ncbi:hypothetical protein QUF50_09545 [Thiotrichales bacterium HSG1]|nr:hypothetical protein [Thiotrichales bacterium HSG1]